MGQEGTSLCSHRRPGPQADPPPTHSLAGAPTVLRAGRRTATRPSQAVPWAEQRWPQVTAPGLQSLLWVTGLLLGLQGCLGRGERCTASLGPWGQGRGPQSTRLGTCSEPVNASRAQVKPQQRGGGFSRRQ